MTRCLSTQSNPYRSRLCYRSNPAAPIIPDDRSKCVTLAQTTTHPPKERWIMKAKTANAPVNGAPVAAPPSTAIALSP